MMHNIKKIANQLAINVTKSSNLYCSYLFISSWYIPIMFMILIPKITTTIRTVNFMHHL